MSITEQIVREAPEVEARKLGLLDSAKALASMPVGGFQYDADGNPILENVIDPITGLPMEDEDGNVIQRPVRTGLPQQQDQHTCLLYTSPSPRDRTRSRMPSSA